jgi:pimeloyl-ACP methyl ester carboxylesterase
MTNLSSNSTFKLADDTGHCIQCDRPDVVIDAIRDVVSDMRGARVAEIFPEGEC